MRALNKTASRSCLHLIAVSSLIIGLAACGGGGGGGSSGNSIALPTAPVTITQTNAPQVAGAAFDTGSGGASLPTGVQTSASASTPSAISTAQTIAKIGQTAALQIISQGAAPATVTGAVQTTNCSVSGTMSSNQTSSTSGSVTYNNCVNIAGVTINGTVSISNIVQTSSSLSLDSVYNLTITTASPANTLTAKGDMRLVIDTNSLAFTLSGASLAMGNTDSARGNFGLQNYSISFDASGNVTAMTFTFASTAINGTATFTTLTPFVTNTGAMFPNSGAATIAGANSTVLKITILGDETAATGSQVKLELSTDGGANYAPAAYHNWADISSRI